MPKITDHLNELTRAARQANDHGYVHTSRALERLISDEQERLRVVYLNGSAFSESYRPLQDYAGRDT